MNVFHRAFSIAVLASFLLPVLVSADSLELVDGSSGAKTGAKVGVGASLLTGGESINVPAGTLLETALRTPLTL